MLDKAKTLKGYKLHSLDGDIGSVSDFYFDDHHWAVRYLVADTGSWLETRQVLIAPHALTAVDRDKHHIVVNLTNAQIEGSPSLDTDKPVSRQFETAYFGYYEWPMYWGGPHMWGYYPHIVHERAFKEDATAGVDTAGLAAGLQREGTASFTASWTSLLSRLADKCTALTRSGP
jgi:hypothetical protein